MTPTFRFIGSVAFLCALHNAASPYNILLAFAFDFRKPGRIQSLAKSAIGSESVVSDQSLEGRVDRLTFFFLGRFKGEPLTTNDGGRRDSAFHFLHEIKKVGFYRGPEQHRFVPISSLMRGNANY